MSSIMRETDTPERNRMRQTNLNHMRQIPPITHPGYIDTIKSEENIRILSLNIREINPWNQYRMSLLKKSIHKHNIDIILLNETQLKWTLANRDKFNKEMKELGREMTVIGTDSKR